MKDKCNVDDIYFDESSEEEIKVIKKKVKKVRFIGIPK